MLPAVEDSNLLGSNSPGQAPHALQCHMVLSYSAAADIGEATAQLRVKLNQTVCSKRAAEVKVEKLSKMIAGLLCGLTLAAVDPSEW